MPYGRASGKVAGEDQRGFNPSYGLHALRAGYIAATPKQPWLVSIPHMGCMPYGHIKEAYRKADAMFQSLIWVACPTGSSQFIRFLASFTPVSIPHMGCMPYGLVELINLL